MMCEIWENLCEFHSHNPVYAITSSFQVTNMLLPKFDFFSQAATPTSPSHGCWGPLWTSGTWHHCSKWCLASKGRQIRAKLLQLPNSMVCLFQAGAVQSHSCHKLGHKQHECYKMRQGDMVKNKNSTTTTIKKDGIISITSLELPLSTCHWRAWIMDCRPHNAA